MAILKTGKAKAIHFSMLEAICVALDRQPGDLLELHAAGSSPAPTPRSSTPT